MAEVWYRDGLRFQCTRCGHCCTGKPGYVWVTADEIAALAAHCGQSVEQFTEFYTRPVGFRRSLREKTNNDCVFYDRKHGCTVYDARPQQCRTWPFWESNVHTPQAWRETCTVCPGSGQGDLIPVEEITRRLKVVRL